MIALDPDAAVSGDTGHDLVPQERRESERLIAYWEREAAQLGSIPTLSAFDLNKIDTDEWSHRFVVTVDLVAENSSLLMYGKHFARLLDQSQALIPNVPLIHQVPAHFLDVFMRGCHDVYKHDVPVPVMVDGEIKHEDGRREFYRAAFVPVEIKPNSLTRLILGTFDFLDRQEMIQPTA
jgi:hypothetical protein